MQELALENFFIIIIISPSVDYNKLRGLYWPLYAVF